MPIQVWIIAALFAVVAVGGGIAYIHRHGEEAGAAVVRDAVQSKAIETITKAGAAKEKADAEVRATPYTERVDGLK